jgi:tetratricopeptide (TPR) repeat protein
MKRVFACVLAALCVAAVAFPARSAVDQSKPVETEEDLPRDARLALYEAQQDLDAGDATKSAATIEKYVKDHEKKDDRFLMHYHLAGVLTQVDRRDDALEHYERAVALEPRYAPAWLGLGETAYGLANYARAADALARGYALMDEKRPDVLYYSAAARVLAGDARTAIPVLEDLTSGTHGSPKFEWYKGLVSACLQAPDSTRGRAAIDAMLKHYGDSPDAWHLAFQYAASVGDYRQAAIALTITGYLRPLTKQERMQLGDLYAAIEVPAAAADYYTSATDDSESATDVERIASAYIASYQTDAALAVLTEGIQNSPTFRLWSLLGDLHVMQKEFQRAYEAFEQCVALSPDELRPQFMMGYCALELGRTDDAIGHLARAAESDDYAERAQMLIRRAQTATHSAP